MKVLVATYPYAGHFNPTQPVVCELVRRGHEVVWMTGPAYEAKVRQTGARFVSMSEDALIDDANIHRIDGKITLGKVADYLRRLFLDRIPAQIRDYKAVIEGTDGKDEKGQKPFPADVLLVEFCTYAARCYHDLTGLPYATLGINPLVTLDPEIPPWGSGEQPPRTFASRLRNRLRHQLGILFFISRLSSSFNKQRRGLGLPPHSRWRSYADDVRSPDLHIMPTTPLFEFPRKNMLESVEFVGPLLPTWLDGKSDGAINKKGKDENATPDVKKEGIADEASDASKAEEWPTPKWWEEMLAHPRERVVHLTQGTFAVNTDLLVKPTIQALADRDDLLVIVTGKNVEDLFENPESAQEQEASKPSGPTKDVPPASGTSATNEHSAAAGAIAAAANVEMTPATSAAPAVPKMRRPANVRTAAFVPHLRLLPHVGVMVTNAGYNGVLAALRCGVPLVCAGRSEDKADVSSRVAWSGAGIDLGTSKPTPQAVRAAVLRIIETASAPSGYRAAAERIRDDFARHNGPAEAADALEALVERNRMGKKNKNEGAARDEKPRQKKVLKMKPRLSREN